MVGFLAAAAFLGLDAPAAVPLEDSLGGGGAATAKAGGGGGGVVEPDKSDRATAICSGVRDLRSAINSSPSVISEELFILFQVSYSVVGVLTVPLFDHFYLSSFSSSFDQSE